MAFGLSPKKGTKARGFRGIGRLGGLGFAQRVVFRTRAVGDQRTTEVSWDCKALRRILADRSETDELDDLVRRVVTVAQHLDTPKAEHFFEVELQGVVRLRSDQLLSAPILCDYLAQVAPVPLSPELQFADEITQFVNRHVPRKRIDLVVNDSAALTRPHRNRFGIHGNKRGEFSRPEFLEIRGIDGRPAVIGWLLHHDYLGALKASPGIRGLRARVGDMQIGAEDLFASVFPEPRFNSWVVGELHVLDTNIVPNGRRDDFEASSAYSNMTNQLSPVGRRLSDLCRASSAERAKLRAFDEREKLVMLIARDLRRRRLSGRRARAAIAEAQGAIEEMENLCNRFKSMRSLRRRLHGCRTALGRANADADRFDPLSVLPRTRREVFEEFVELLVSCSANRRTAEQLVQRITRRLLRRHSRVSGSSSV